MTAPERLPGRSIATSRALTPDRARHMRRVATGLLILMAGVFAVAHTQLDVHPAWGFVHAFAEAAMVGGLADWFAVTALFRHPLGIPIPHTAIIPENKDRIADTMASFLRSNFLTATVVARRMRAMNFARAAGDFLARPPEAEGSRYRLGAGEIVAEVLESLDPERLGGQVRAGLVHQLEKLEVSPLLGQMLAGAIADKRHLPLLDSLIRWAGLTLEDNEELVRKGWHVVEKNQNRIYNLVMEREARRQEVVQEVSAKWASAQTIAPPFLVVNYAEPGIGADGKPLVANKPLVLLPQTLVADGKVFPETRSRSIYDILLYRANLGFSGTFQPEWPADVDPSRIDFSTAKICFGLNDFKGIEYA